MRKVIRAAQVISMDSTIGDLPCADIVIDEHGRIESIRPTATSGIIGESRDTETIDADGMIAMPGFVDTHRHLWTTLLRGFSADLPVHGYRQYSKGVVAPRVRSEDVYIATLAGALDAIDCGITTIVDVAHIMKSPEFGDAAVDALKDSGMRAVLAHSHPTGADTAAWLKDSALTHPSDIARLRHERLSDDSALVTLGMGVRPPFFLKPETLRADVAMARILDLRMTFDGIGAAIGAPGRWAEPHMQTLSVLDSAGLLGDDMTFVHFNEVPDDELLALRDAGAHLSIASVVEMSCGYGVPALERATKLGIRPSLSADTVVQASGDMFGVMRTAMLSMRGVLAHASYCGGAPVEKWDVTSRDMLEFATMCGARAVGKASQVGSISPGKWADLILVDRRSLSMAGVSDPAIAVATFAHPGNVDTVLVAGTVLKRAGRLRHPGIVEILSGLQAAREHVTQGSRLDSDTNVEEIWRW